MLGSYFYTTRPDDRLWPRLVAFVLCRPAPTITTRHPVIQTVDDALGKAMSALFPGCVIGRPAPACGGHTHEVPQGDPSHTHPPAYTVTIRGSD
jgi:hypothetical protein